MTGRTIAVGGNQGRGDPAAPVKTPALQLPAQTFPSIHGGIEGLDVLASVGRPGVPASIMFHARSTRFEFTHHLPLDAARALAVHLVACLRALDRQP
jgi:hypothetical protein